ncbi:MAG: hypothetical protein HON90_03410 [Halobacteriovoraceae bacterium]|jgi:hypothetical protein|nr:hypothetical protein [Halobacteriovoraceae bacterium]
MISYPLILDITESFYTTAVKDILIGYHFRVIDDFDTHIPRIADFWNLQLNSSINDRANLPYDLFNTHLALKINKGEIFRWEKLFAENLDLFITKNLITEDQKDIWMKKVSFFREKLLMMLFT